jgi:hypothetical protein
MPSPVIAIGYDALDNPTALYVGYDESAALAAIQAAGSGWCCKFFRNFAFFTVFNSNL